MNKLELIQAVKDKTGLSKQEASDVVTLCFDGYTEATINEVNTFDQVNSIEHRFWVI